MSKIVKVKEKNDWERRTYFAGKKELEPNKFNSTYISWPDGTQEKVEVIWLSESHSYTDHNYSDTVTSMVPYVKINHLGLVITVKLSKLSILV